MIATFVAALIFLMVFMALSFALSVQLCRATEEIARLKKKD